MTSRCSASAFLLVTVSSLLILAACGRTASTSDSSTLRVAKAGEAEGLDPARYTDGETFLYTNTVYDHLVEFRRQSGSIVAVPALAESWELSDDGLVYTFRLRQGVTFHNGNPFTSDDVLYSFARQWKGPMTDDGSERVPLEDHHFSQDGLPIAWKYWNGMGFDETVVAMEAPEPHTFIIRLSQPVSTLIKILGMDPMAIMDKEYAYEVGQDALEAEPMGTGPFIFERWEQDQFMILRRNTEYWNIDDPTYRANFDKLIFRVMPTPNVRYGSLQSSAVDFIDMPLPNDVKAMEDEPDRFNVYSDRDDNLSILYMAFNLRYQGDDPLLGPLRNEDGSLNESAHKLRQAIAHAIDRETIIENVYRGRSRPARMVVADNWAPWNQIGENIAIPQYDPARAKELLTEAGYPDGTPRALRLWTPDNKISRPYLPSGPDVGRLIKNDLESIGIKVTLVNEPWQSYIAKTQNGEHEMCLLGWSPDIPDPDNFYYILLNTNTAREDLSQNLSRYTNDDVQALFEEARRVPAEQEQRRIELYTQAQRKITEELPWMVLLHGERVAATTKRVTAFDLEPIGKRRFQTVRMNLPGSDATEAESAENQG